MTQPQTFFDFFRDVMSKGKRIIFVGFGNPDRADDGFGIFLTRKLKNLFPNFTYNEVDDDIESLFLDILKDRVLTDFIVYLDVIDSNKPTGELMFLNLDTVKLAHTLSTHSSLLPVYFSLLKKKCKGQYILGVPPVSLELFQPLSESIATKIDYIIKTLKATYKEIKYKEQGTQSTSAVQNSK